MGRRYSAGVTVDSSIAVGGLYAEMLCGATKSINLVSLRVTTRSNNGGQIGLRRSFAQGTGTTVATGEPHRSTNVGSDARLVTAWSPVPTGGALLMRSETLPVQTGWGIYFWREEDGPIAIEPGKSLLITNHGSGIQAGALHINATWDEGPASDI